MSTPVQPSPNPPGGAQSSGAAVYSSTYTVAGQGPGSQGPLAYFKTLAGILKIGSVILGLFALSLTAYAYKNGEWFHPIECPRSGCPEGEDEYFEDLSKKAFNRTIPTRWLVAPQVYIIAFPWAGTLIVLVVLLFVDLSKISGFSIVDMIGHLGAGCLAIISALCLIGFVISVWIFGLCRDLFKDIKRRTLEEKYSNATVIGRSSSDDKVCKESEERLFKKWHVLFGEFFAGATGVVYVLIALMALKSTKGQQVRPMQGQYGATMQTQSGYGSTPQQSPVLSPPKV